MIVENGLRTELDGLIKVRQRSMLLESGIEADDKVVDRYGSIKMAKGVTTASTSML
jgi:hypothetical protein